MRILYDNNYFKITMSFTEIALYQSSKNNSDFVFNGFLDNYSMDSEGNYYPDIILNKQLTCTYKNDTYFNQVATTTTYNSSNVLGSNNWFIDYDGTLKNLNDLSSQQSKLFCVKEGNSYVTRFSDSLNFPRPGTNLFISNTVTPDVTLSSYIHFTLDLENGKINIMNTFDEGSFY